MYRGRQPNLQTGIGWVDCDLQSNDLRYEYVALSMTLLLTTKIKESS